MKPIWLSILLFFYCVTGTLHIQTEENLYTFPSVTIHYWNNSTALSENYNVNVSSFFIYGSDEGSPEGRVVFIQFRYGIDDVARTLLSEGAVGLVVDSDEPVYAGKSGSKLTRPRTYVSLPTAEVNSTVYDLVVEDIFKNERVLWIQMESTSPETNSYFYVNRDINRFYNVFGGILVGSLVIASIVLSVLEIVKEGEVKISVKTVLLIMLFISSAVKLVLVFDLTGIDKVLPWSVQIFANFLNIPLMVITELLVSLFWFESMTSALHDQKLLSSTRVPFIIIIVFFAATLIVMAIIGAVSPLLFSRMMNILGVVYFIALTILATFHFVVAFKLYSLVNEINKKARLKKNSKIFIYKIIAISSTDVLMILLIIWVLVSPPLPLVFSSLKVLFLQIVPSLHIAVTLTLFQWNLSLSSSSSSTRKSKGRSTKESAQ